MPQASFVVTEQRRSFAELGRSNLNKLEPRDTASRKAPQTSTPDHEISSLAAVTSFTLKNSKTPPSIDEPKHERGRRRASNQETGTRCAEALNQLRSAKRRAHSTTPSYQSPTHSSLNRTALAKPDKARGSTAVSNTSLDAHANTRKRLSVPVIGGSSNSILTSSSQREAQGGHRTKMRRATIPSRRTPNPLYTIWAHDTTPLPRSDTLDHVDMSERLGSRSPVALSGNKGPGAASSQPASQAQGLRDVLRSDQLLQDPRTSPARVINRDSVSNSPDFPHYPIGPQAKPTLSSLNTVTQVPAMLNDPSRRIGSMPSMYFDLAQNSGGSVGSGNVANSIVNSYNTFHESSQQDQGVLQRIEEKLGMYVVQEALLTRDIHGDCSVCYQGTRENLLAQILSWVGARSESGMEHEKLTERASCIVGPPGSGKSTILNTVIIDLLREATLRCPGLITSHYSIRRSIKPTTDQDKILTTLVYQLARHSPQVGERVVQLLDTVPHTGVLSKDLPQLMFLEAVKAYGDMVFVIVDALDEASKPAMLAATLSRVIRESPPNLRLLLATRNEHGVLASLGNDIIPDIARDIPTEESIFEVGQYISGTLRAGVKALFGDKPEWKQWPTESQMQSLSDRADGLFLWARIAVDFILSRLQKRGTCDRDKWITEVGKVGMAGVDVLYRLILESYVEEGGFDPPEEVTLMLTRMKEVLGLIIVAEHPLSLDNITTILSFDDFDVAHFVERCRSILVPGITTITRLTVPQMHKTFVDHITSDRAGRFQIHIEEQHRSVFHHCFKVMASQLRFNMIGLQSSFLRNDQVRDLDDRIRALPGGLVYASTSWAYHLKHAGLSFFPLELDSIRSLLHENLLPWLEIVGLKRKEQVAEAWLRELADRIASNAPGMVAGSADVAGLANFARDASTLLEKFQVCIRTSTPHIYISLPAFSPKDSVVASHYRRKLVSMTVIPHPSGIPSQWDSWRTDPGVISHDTVLSLAFSSSSPHIAAGYSGGMVWIWDYETDEPALGPLRGHEKSVISLCFSPNGLLLASGSNDTTIRVWNSRTGECIVGPLMGHKMPVYSLTFSPESNYFAASSKDNRIRVWDARTGDCVLGPLKAYDGAIVRSLSYFPAISPKASTSSDEAMRLWDGRSDACFIVDSGDEFCIGLSSDRHLHLSHPQNDRDSGQHARTPDATSPIDHDHSSNVCAVCFSSDGRYTATGFDDQTVHIWDTETASCVAGPINGNGDKISSVAFSHNGEHLAVGSWDGTVRLWDVKALLSNALRCESVQASDTAQRRSPPAAHRAQVLYTPPVKAQLMDLTVVDKEGWTVGPNEELLFWAPWLYRGAIWRPSTVRLLGRPALIRPDLTGLITGEEWLDCWGVNSRRSGNKLRGSTLISPAHQLPFSLPSQN